MRPTELFAVSDERSFPTIRPIVVEMPQDTLSTDVGDDDDDDGDDERRSKRTKLMAPTYGLPRMGTLHKKYAISRNASEWFETVHSSPWFAPNKRSKTILVDYWDRCKQWTEEQIVCRHSCRRGRRVASLGSFLNGRDVNVVDVEQ